MLLAVDTSGRQGSIALARGNPDGSCDVIEIVPLAGGTFSAELVPRLAALLSKHGFNKQEIGAFAVASGPGSFTGLRVGLAAIKALAEVLEKPIAAVSLLEAVAVAGRSRGRVVAALDAGRHEFYMGEYEVAAARARMIAERLVTLEELTEAATGLTIITTDKIVAEAARGKGIRVEEIGRPGCDAIARLGWRKIQAGDTVSPEQLDANYIRRSVAEISSRSSS
jgi:tRNA threonylcarbamoyladenosine biosynthesis protein TsaB